MLRVYAHNVGSEGLNALRESITPFMDKFHRGLRHEYPGLAGRSSRSVLASNRPDAPCFAGANKVIVGWGNSTPLISQVATTSLHFNKPEAIGKATNKLTFFQTVDAWNENADAEDEISTVEWTTSREEASQWLDGNTAVYCRTSLQGSAGDGIIVATTIDEMVDANLYTKGISGARREYRVHVFNGEVILSQTKRRRSGSQTDELVRNLDGGWIFGVSNSNPSNAVKRNAILAVKALGLNFGAVDIIAKGARGGESESYVLEVNTAPGQRGATTVAAYSKALIDEMVDWYAMRCDIRIEEDTSTEEILGEMFEEGTNLNNILEQYAIIKQSVSEIPDDPADGSEAPIPQRRQAPQQPSPQRPTLDSLLSPLSSSPISGTFSTGSAGSSSRIQAEAPLTAAPTTVTRVSALSTAPSEGNYYAVATVNSERLIGKVVRRRGRELFYIVGADAPIPMRQVTLESVISLD